MTSWSLWLGILLTLVPIIELRGGLPLVIKYCIDNGLNIWPYFFLVVLLNSLISIFIFLFLDFGNSIFMRIKFYRNFMNKYINHLRKKIDSVNSNMKKIGFFALTLFVAIPLPATGVWSGVLISWILKLDRTKSIISISLGALIAGIIVLLLSLGLFNLF